MNERIGESFSEFRDMILPNKREIAVVIIGAAGAASLGILVSAVDGADSILSSIGIFFNTLTDPSYPSAPELPSRGGGLLNPPLYTPWR